MDDKNLKTLIQFESEKKSIAAAFILGIQLGILGGHDYYLGDIGRGIFKLILTITMIGIIFSIIWVIIDLISMPSRVREKNRQLAERLTA
ncbi:MAG: TM2 domain-containing protein [Robiginitomaculum sp.]|nr:TM2 domain-containing protein [Robiginitomaculum sp.]